MSGRKIVNGRKLKGNEKNEKRAQKETKKKKKTTENEYKLQRARLSSCHICLMLIVAATMAHNSFSSVLLQHAFYIFDSNFHLQYGFVRENNKNRYVSTIIWLLIIHTRLIVVPKEIVHCSNNQTIRRSAWIDTENRFDESNQYKSINNGFSSSLRGGETDCGAGEQPDEMHWLRISAPTYVIMLRFLTCMKLRHHFLQRRSVHIRTSNDHSVQNRTEKEKMKTGYRRNIKHRSAFSAL